VTGEAWARKVVLVHPRRRGRHALDGQRWSVVGCLLLVSDQFVPEQRAYVQWKTNGPRATSSIRSIAAGKFRIRRGATAKVIRRQQGRHLMHARFHSCVKVVGSREHVAANYWYNPSSALISSAATMHTGRIESGGGEYTAWHD
jgi:hypothetical protein